VSSLQTEKQLRNPNAIALLPADAVVTLSKFSKLGESVGDYSIVIDHFTRYDNTGVPWGNINYQHFKEKYGQNVLVIQYETLVNILVKYTEFQERIFKDYSNSVTAISQNIIDADERTVEVNVSFEKTPQFSNRIFHHLIVAEGCRSKVRGLIWKPSEILVSEFCLRRYSITIKRPQDFPHNRYIEMLGESKVLGFAPVIGGKLAVWAYSKADENIVPITEEVTYEPVSRWIDEFSSFRGYWESIAEEIKKMDKMSVDYVFDFRLQSVPYYNQVGLIGGAARGVFPFIYGHENSNTILEAVMNGEMICRKDLPSRHFFPTTHYTRNNRNKHLQETAFAAATNYCEDLAFWKRRIKPYLLKYNNTTQKLTDKAHALMTLAIQINEEERSKVENFEVNKF